MKTMMPRASIVLLIGLAALTQIASAKDKTHYYVVTPKEMTSDAKKNSKVVKYYDWMAKIDKKQEEANKLEEERKGLDEKLAEANALVNKANEKDQKLKDAKQAVAAQEVVVTTAGKAVDAAKELKPADGVSEEDKKKFEETKAATLKKAQDKKKEEDEELQKLKDVEAEWTKFEEKAKAAKWDPSKTGDDACQWIKDQQAAQKKLNEKDAELTKATNNEEGRKPGDPKDGKPTTKADPENGGLEYLKNQASAAMTPATDLSELQASGLTVVGFYGDPQTGTAFLVSTDDQDLATEKAVQEIFDHEVAASDGHKAEPYSYADVKAIDEKDAKATVTTNHFVKIVKGKTDHMEHGALIHELVIYYEAIQLERCAKDNAGKDKTKDETKDGKVIQVPDMQQYHKLFLNFQGLKFQVYTENKASVADEFEALDSYRASDTYKVVGDFTALDKVASLGCSGSSKGKEDGGSNTWKIVAIIFIVIVVLGGLVLGYQAYNASGSLQNTDI